MDPITITLIALGAGGLVLMVFFLIASAAILLATIDSACKEIIRLIYESEEKKSTLKAENEREKRKLEEFQKILEEERKKMEEEKAIVTEIQSIVKESPHKIALKLPRLIQLIYESLILRNNLKNPENSINAVKKKIEDLKERFRTI
ncbi:MAG: hypothetical protein F6K04_01195 [Leptolyngbya sp. SIO4C5]|nr:hypothetical protein [Leptolyngbya sp. SIO4C5]